MFYGLSLPMKIFRFSTLFTTTCSLVPLGASGAADADGSLLITRMRCEYQERPLAVESQAPRFTWWLSSSEQGAEESACRITVFDRQSHIWDSGKVSRAGSAPLVYAGPSLEAGKLYSWQLEVWDQNDLVTRSASRSFFRMAPDLSDSEAIWAAATAAAQRSPLLRSEFKVKGEIAAAYAHVSGIGYAELYLNGEKTSDAVMEPAPTQYEKRLYYATHDVTGSLKPGLNAVGLWLNEGQAAITMEKPERFHNLAREYPGPFSQPAGWLQLDIEYTDGSRETIATDADWKWSNSPLTYAHFYGGEDYDARLEDPSWHQAGYDDSSWQSVTEMQVATPLYPQQMPPMRVVDVLEPIGTRELGKGVYLYDFGQNIGGWWRLSLRGKKGLLVKARGAETLDESIFPGGFEDSKGISLGFAHGRGGHYERDAITHYILKGDGEEVYEPRFFYSGFRYLQVEVNSPDDLESIEAAGCAVYSDIEVLGSFHSSDELLNQLHHNTLWSLKGVFQGAPMSNPNSEKYGWTGDAHLFAMGANAIFDTQLFWEKWLLDLRDSQAMRSDGSIDHTVPNYRTSKSPTTAVWGGAYPFVAWYLYQQSGDKRILEEHYQPLVAWADYLASTAVDDLVSGIWADHVAPGYAEDGSHKSFAMTHNLRRLAGTCYYARTEQIVAEMARALGDESAAKAHSERVLTAVEALNQHFFDKANGVYFADPEEETPPGHYPFQTANLLPLQFGFEPESKRESILQKALSDIQETHDGHLMTGIIGTKSLVEVFTMERMGDTLYDIATIPTYPGWGYWLAKGATEHWQHWDGAPDHNHAMFGTIEEFLMQGVAGIIPPTFDDTSLGWKQVRIAPQFLEKLDWAEGAVPTPHGILRLRWEKRDDDLYLECDIPVNCTAMIVAPASYSENADTIEKSLPSGEYRFLIQNGQFVEL